MSEFYEKSSLSKRFLAFKNGVRNIQTGGYYGACTVFRFLIEDVSAEEYNSCTKIFLATFIVVARVAG